MTDTSDPNYGILTDEAFVKSRMRIGIPARRSTVPHNYEVTWDAIRHFAYGYGDDNPQFCDPDYAAQTHWKGLIAPPTFHYTMGDAYPHNHTDEEKAILKGDPFAGLGSYQAVMEYEFWDPQRIGEGLTVLAAQVGVADKKSDFGGRTAHVTHDFIYANEKGELKAIRRGTWINAERHASRERKKEHDLPEPYTPEQLAEIDACYAAETRRGNVPRYFEDVQIGEELDKKVKGPLVTTDVVVWHLGWGMQLTPPGAFKIAANIRRKAPGLYPPNALNIPDTVQRLHWDPIRAQELGLPTSYDYGGMRETWLVHLLTDWIGDDGWLWKFECQHRRFNFIGDTSWLTGEVVDKKQVETSDGVRSEVHINLRVTNQRGVVTSPGKAIVLLPSREHGDVKIPRPPAKTMESMLQYEIDRLKPE